MNDILKSNEIINNNELDILIDDINDDEELSSLIQCFPKETKQFILKLRNSHLDKSNNGQLKQNSIKQTHRCLTNFDVEAPFSTSTTYRNTFCHQTNNNVNEQNETSKFPIGQPILRFGEMPVFTDSILYPGQNRRLQSTTHETFVEKPMSFLRYQSDHLISYLLINLKVFSILILICHKNFWNFVLTDNINLDKDPTENNVSLCVSFYYLNSKYLLLK
ncbi:hypothetical protein MS3_00009183 [Schistosoma haematobium]|uniref:Uncharacterized protein n=1 Tax=Schistosoma haematobium TaxID=6185 RepID=A0A922LE78_SCHHA|nr:hypothetical protein MS3_00009183 [Schistosoma haematobium]KAH9580573.1 hypothetical protein MS3_00009183 [Schistosoma haematobium]